MILPAIEAGVEGIIIDWERIGKQERQVFANTQINQDTIEDLKRVRNCIDSTVICRINSLHRNTRLEIDKAITAGVDEILLPMVRKAEEVEKVLKHIDQRCRLGILIETIDAIRHIDEFACLPLSRVYVGLNDLAIERGTTNIFSPLSDGTLEEIRSNIPHPFGFAGLTLPEKGFPIPCRLLIGEMARLNCQFSFLRRSFHRDIQGRNLMKEIPRIYEALDSAYKRSKEAVEQDRIDLVNFISSYACKTLLQSEHHGRL